jgi:hypothetical protein
LALKAIKAFPEKGIARIVGWNDDTDFGHRKFSIYGSVRVIYKINSEKKQ